MKKISIRFISFIMIICCLILSCSVPVLSVKASAPLEIAGSLAKWFLTTTGTVEVSDGIRGSSLITNIKDKITEFINNGYIYKSSNGEYIFSNDATNELYEILDSDSNYDARVVSSFPDFIVGSFQYFDQSVFNQEFIQNVTNCIQSLDNHMVVVNQDKSQSYRRYITRATVFDVSNLCYMTVNDRREIHFFNENGQNIYLPYTNFSCVYYYERGNYENNINSYENQTANYMGFSDSFTVDEWFLNFPLLDSAYIMNDRKYAYIYSSNHSLLIAKSSAAANLLLRKNTGTFITNHYTTMPSVTEETLINNNWDNIYNSYVSTANNSYQTIYETNGTVTGNEIRDILADTSNDLEEIIQNATQEITEDLENSNEWLKKIYDRLAILESHFSSVENYQDDYLNALENIEDKVNEMSADTVYLVEIYSYLDTIVNAINNNSGGGGGGVRFPDIVDTLPDMPDTDIMDIMSRSAVLVSALETVAPLAYLPLIEGLLMSLSAEPETPVFEIPFVFDNDFVHIDKKIVIDFSYVSDLQVVFNALIHIIFIIFLIYLTFELSDIVGNILF